MTGPNAQTCSEEGGDFPLRSCMPSTRGLALTGWEFPPWKPSSSPTRTALGKAVCWGNLSETIPNELIRSLHSHPARLLSWMDRKYYTA